MQDFELKLGWSMVYVDGVLAIACDCCGAQSSWQGKEKFAELRATKKACDACTELALDLGASLKHLLRIVKKQLTDELDEKIDRHSNYEHAG